MSSLLFISGQIRALESRLLTKNRLERMIGASTPEDAFRVMAELEYARFFDESTKAGEFSKIIEQGILESKEMIRKAVGNHSAFEFIFRRYDLNNLKQALKQKLVQGKTELPEFTEENGFSTFGDLPPEEITRVVFAGQISEVLPVPYQEAITKSSAVYEEKKEFRYVEFLLDQAHFVHLNSCAHGAFLREFFNRIVDAANLRLIARSLLFHSESVPSEAFVPFGEITYQQAAKVTSVKELKDLVARTRFHSCAAELDESKSPAENLFAIEGAADSDYQQFLRDSDQGEIGSIQVPMIYFERRLRDARWLKFIMFSKSKQINH